MSYEEFGEHRKLLVSFSTATFDRRLAGAIGLSEALLLQDIFFWSRPDFVNTKEADGRNWVRASVRKWTEEKYPWSSRGTTQRTLAKLIKAGLLYERHDLNEHGYDKTAWYTVNTDQVAVLAQMVKRDPKTAKLAELPPSESWQELMGGGDSPWDTLTPGEPPSSEVGDTAGATLTHSESPTASQAVPGSQRGASHGESTILKKEKEDGISVFQESWSSFLDLLKGGLTADVFRASYKGSRPLAVDGKVLEIEVVSEGAADWVNNKLAASTLHTLKAAIPGTDIHIIEATPCAAK